MFCLENKENSEDYLMKICKQTIPPRVLRAARVVFKWYHKLVWAEEEKWSSINNLRYFIAQNQDRFRGEHSWLASRDISSLLFMNKNVIASTSTHLIKSNLIIKSLAWKRPFSFRFFSVFSYSNRRAKKLFAGFFLVYLRAIVTSKQTWFQHLSWSIDF